MKREAFSIAQGEDPNAMNFYALTVAGKVGEPCRGLLLLPADLDPQDQGQEQELGAPYELLEAIAHICGFEETERVR